MCKGLKAGGIEKIHLVAPTNSAVDVLRSEGFNSAQTVAMFLQNRSALPPNGSYLIIDESGLNSLREGVEMMKIAVEKDYRVLFVGDVRQHKSVESGDFLRLLEEHSSIVETELKEIHRQQTEEYRHGIELAAAGSFVESFHQLDDHGFVHEDKGKYLEAAAESFYELTGNGTRPLDCIAVVPTIRECDKLTQLIRDRMVKGGHIQTENEYAAPAFQSFGWTKQKLHDLKNYQPGQAVFFPTRVKGIAEPGEMAVIASVEEDGLHLDDGRIIDPKKCGNGIDVGIKSD